MVSAPAVIARGILAAIWRGLTWYYQSLTRRQKPGCCKLCDDPLGPNDPFYCIEHRDAAGW